MYTAGCHAKGSSRYPTTSAASCSWRSLLIWTQRGILNALEINRFTGDYDWNGVLGTTKEWVMWEVNLRSILRSIMVNSEVIIQ